MTRIALDALVQITASLQTQFEQADPVIPANVMVRCDDTGLVKIGNGVTVWSLLPNWYEETFTTDMKTFLETHNQANAILVLNGNGKVSVDYLPNGSTTQRGMVQLSDATDSDDSTKAASSKAVKLLADMIGDNNSTWYKPQCIIDAPSDFIIVPNDLQGGYGEQERYTGTIPTITLTGFGIYNHFNQALLFDGVAGSTTGPGYAYPLNTGSGSTLLMEFASGIALTKWRVHFSASYNNGTWNVEYSDDGISWSLAYEGWSWLTSGDNWVESQWANKGIRKYWRAKINTAINAHYLNEIELFHEPVQVSSDEIEIISPMRVVLAGQDGNVIVKDIAEDISVPFIYDGASVADGIQYISVEPSGLSVVLDTLPVFNTSNYKWADDVSRHILGWVAVDNGSVVGHMQCSTGTYTEILPEGTVMPNPFIYLPIFAIQDGTPCPIVDNEITNINVSGGMIRVWRIS